MSTAYVQSNVNRGFPGATTLTVGLTSVAAGNLLAVGIGWSDTAVTLNSVSDATNGTHTLLKNPTTDTTVWRAAMAYKENTGAATITITATWSADPGLAILVVHEISGAATSSSVDDSIMTALGGLGSGTDVVSVNIVPTVVGDYLFGVDFSVDGNGVLTAGTGYTQRIQDASKQVTTEDIANYSSTGTKAVTWTDASVDHHIAGAIAFKAAAGGPGAGADSLSMGESDVVRPVTVTLSIAESG